MKINTMAKRLVALGTIAGFAVTLSACTTAAAPEDNTLTIVSYSAGADKNSRFQAVADAFEAANPDVSVTVELIPGDGTYDTLVRSQIQSGKSPDLFEVLNNLSGLQPYEEAGLLEDLSNEAWISRQVEGVQATKEYFGATYQYTAELNAIGVIYNKDIFAANGLDVPTTWVEFEDVIAKLNSAGVTPLAVGAKDGWPIPLQASGMVVQSDELATGTSAAADLASGALKFSESTAWNDALTAFESLVKSGGFDPQASGIDWPSSAGQMANGEAAMMIQATFAFPTIRLANPDVNLGMFPLPYEKPVVGFGLGAMLAMPADGNTVLAKKFLDFFAQQDTMTEWVTTGSAISPFTDVDSATDPATLELIDALVQASAEYNLSTGITASTAAVLTPGLQGIIAGNETAEGLLAKLDAAQG